MPLARYISVANVRAEGPPFNDDSTYDNDWVEDKIDLASSAIERLTGNWFVEIERTGVGALKLDGTGSKFLSVPFPIIQIDSITLTYAARFGTPSTDEIDPSEVVIYNRHLTQGLLDPNDRKNPGLSIEGYLGYRNDHLPTWPKGDQNVALEGKFGWTELGVGDSVGETEAGSQVPLSKGSTPPEIKRICMLLVRRYWPQVGDMKGMLGVSKPLGSITEMKNRDQFRRWAEPKEQPLPGGTGDPDIDRALLAFRRAPRMGWA